MADHLILADAFAYADGALTGNGSWIVRRGGLFGALNVASGVAAGNSTGGLSNTLNAASIAECYADLDITFTAVGVNNTQAVVYLRDNDAPTAALWESIYVVFVANPTTGNSVQIVKRIGGTATVIAAHAYNAAGRPVWEANVAKRIRFSCVGLTASVSWDGGTPLVGTLSAGEIRSGKFALYGVQALTGYPKFDNLTFGTFCFPDYFRRHVTRRAIA